MFQVAVSPACRTTCAEPSCSTPTEVSREDRPSVAVADCDPSSTSADPTRAPHLPPSAATRLSDLLLCGQRLPFAA
jgi:hypothetical protein